MNLRHLTTASALAAALLLSACTITILPDTGGPNVDRPPVVVRPAAITSFEALRSTYRVGDTITFRIRTTSPGYVTLTAFNPDGSSYPIARNVAVRGNRLETIPGPDSRIVFFAEPPVGRHVVRAHFTPERTAETVSFRGIASMDAWLAAIVFEIRAYGFDVDDVAEVRVDIR
jgi:hypothetical protein